MYKTNNRILFLVTNILDYDMYYWLIDFWYDMYYWLVDFLCDMYYWFIDIDMICIIGSLTLIWYVLLAHWYWYDMHYWLIDFDMICTTGSFTLIWYVLLAHWFWYDMYYWLIDIDMIYTIVYLIILDTKGDLFAMRWNFLSDHKQ